MNYFQDETEWQWLFNNAIDWDTIIPMYYPSYPTEEGFESKEEVMDFLKDILINTGQWCGTSLYKHGQKLDIEGAGTIKDGKTYPGPTLTQIYKEAKELELFGLPFPHKYGGLALPVTMQMFFCAQVARSCMSTCTQLAFYTSIGEMIYRYCDEKTAMRLVPKIATGEISGSMCLTEPGCGSDLGLIKTMATPTENENEYLLNGTKCFISNGGGGLGFVLAKIKGGPEGLAGISMFLAEQDLGDGENNYIVSKAEEKMGMHGSFTCEIVYENTVATLVGEEGMGFKYMLHLMNEARIAVALQSMGGMEGALNYAYKYASKREQFGKPIKDLPLLKRNIEDYITEQDAIRALLMDTTSFFDIHQKLELKKKNEGDLTNDENKLLKESTMWVRKRTPLVKYYACEKYTEISQKTIQILGGYGFMQEYPVERYHRDSFGPLLYEGTSQIQALMALKDLIKSIIKNPTSFFGNIVKVHPTLSMIKTKSQESEKLYKEEYRFHKKLIALLLKTLKPKSGKLFDSKSWASEENIEKLMIHAETLTQAMSYIETLRVLAKHAELDKARKGLFASYYKLILPRLEQIYMDWKIRE